MSGGVPKKISISRTQRNTFCKSGGWGQQGLILCGGQRGKKGMCNYIKKRVNHREKPAPKAVLPLNPDAPIETVNFNNPINTGVLGGKNIYQFIANGSLQINLRSPKSNTADYFTEPIKNACGQITGYKPSNTAKTVSFDLEYYMIGGGGAGGQAANGSGGGVDFGGGGAAGVVRQGTITVSGQLGTTINVSLEVGTGGVPSGNNGSQSGSGQDTSIQVVGGTTVVAKGGEGGFAGDGNGGNGGSNVDFAGGQNALQGPTNQQYSVFRAGGGAGAGGAGSNAIDASLDGGGYLNYSNPVNQSAGVNVNFANNGWIALPNVPILTGAQTIGGGGGGACVTGTLGLPGPPPVPGTQQSGFGGQGPPTVPGLVATGTKVGGDGVGGGPSVGNGSYKGGSAGLANTGSGGGGGNFVNGVNVSGYAGGNGFVQVRFLSSLL